MHSCLPDGIPPVPSHHHIKQDFTCRSAETGDDGNTKASHTNASLKSPGATRENRSGQAEEAPSALEIYRRCRECMVETKDL